MSTNLYYNQWGDEIPIHSSFGIKISPKDKILSIDGGLMGNLSLSYEDGYLILKGKDDMVVSEVLISGGSTPAGEKMESITYNQLTKNIEIKLVDLSTGDDRTLTLDAVQLYNIYSEGKGIKMSYDETSNSFKIDVDYGVGLKLDGNGKLTFDDDVLSTDAEVLSAMTKVSLSSITDVLTVYSADSGTTIDFNISDSDFFLTKESDGLKMNLTLVKMQIPSSSAYVSSYELQDKNGVRVGDIINIPNDIYVVSGIVGVVTTTDQPYAPSKIGERYIDLYLSNNTHIYISAKDITPDYTGSHGIIVDNNNRVISVNYGDGLRVNNSAELVPKFSENDRFLEIDRGGMKVGLNLVKMASPSSSAYTSSYELVDKDGNRIGDVIDIPRDVFIESGSVKTVTTPDVPYIGAKVGDEYFDFVLINGQHIYLPVRDMVPPLYNGGDAIDVDADTINVKYSDSLEVNQENELEVRISQNDKLLKIDGDGISVNIGMERLQVPSSSAYLATYILTDKDGNKIGDQIDIPSSSGKMDIVSGANENNVTVFNTTGGVKDSGTRLNELLTMTDADDRYSKIYYRPETGSTETKSLPQIQVGDEINGIDPTNPFQVGDVLSGVEPPITERGLFFDFGNGGKLWWRFEKRPNGKYTNNLYLLQPNQYGYISNYSIDFSYNSSTSAFTVTSVDIEPRLMYFYYREDIITGWNVTNITVGTAETTTVEENRTFFETLFSDRILAITYMDYQYDDVETLHYSLQNKMDKLSPNSALTDNVAIFESGGTVVDSGVKIDDLLTKEQAYLDFASVMDVPKTVSAQTKALQNFVVGDVLDGIELRNLYELGQVLTAEKVLNPMSDAFNFDFQNGARLFFSLIFGGVVGLVYPNRLRISIRPRPLAGETLLLEINFNTGDTFSVNSISTQSPSLSFANIVGINSGWTVTNISTMSALSAAIERRNKLFGDNIQGVGVTTEVQYDTINIEWLYNKVSGITSADTPIFLNSFVYDPKKATEITEFYASGIGVMEPQIPEYGIWLGNGYYSIPDMAEQPNRTLWSDSIKNIFVIFEFSFDKDAKIINYHDQSEESSFELKLDANKTYYLVVDSNTSNYLLRLGQPISDYTVYSKWWLFDEGFKEVTNNKWISLASVRDSNDITIGRIEPYNSGDIVKFTKLRYV
jgi:hypothetical protein